MFDPQKPLDRLLEESEAAHDALLDYWKMGSERTVQALANEYKARAAAAKKSEKNRKWPTYYSLKTWSTKYQWLDRVKMAEKIKAASVIQESYDEYLDKVNRLRAESWNFSALLFKEATEQVKAATAMREKLDLEDALTPNALKTIATSVNMSASTHGISLSNACQSLGLDKVLDSFLDQKNNN